MRSIRAGAGAGRFHFLDDPPLPSPLVPMRLHKDVSEQSDEERALVRMVGVPLASGYKVGDVHGAIVGMNYDLPVLKSFLLWAGLTSF